MRFPILHSTPVPWISPSWTARGEDAASRFGYRACYAGDVNGDGYSDLIVGAPGFDHSRGKAYLYLGGPKGLSEKPAWTFQGEEPGDAFGDRVGSAGDVNGDGFGDIYVSASSWKHGLGKLYVFHGGAAGPGANAVLERAWKEGSPPLSFGDLQPVPTGDLNGDGFDDLAVGAYGFDGTRGEVFVYYGSKQGLAKAPAWRAEGESKGDQFGYGLGPAGDVNGDGYDDLVIASKYHSQGQPQAGKAYLYLGSAKGLGRASWTALGRSQGANLGTRVYGAGDLNGDGLPDLAWQAPPTQTKAAGKSWPMLARPSGLAGQPFFILAAPEGRTGFGFCLGPLGRLGENSEPGFFVSSRSDAGGVVDIYQVDPEAGASVEAKPQRPA